MKSGSIPVEITKQVRDQKKNLEEVSAIANANVGVYLAGLNSSQNGKTN